MSDLVTSRIFTDGEKGITATKMNDIIGGASIQTAFYSAKSTASTADAADTLLLLKAAGSYAQVPVSTFVTSVAGQLPSSDPEIWSVRLRSVNACGNPSFFVDQVNVGAGCTNVPHGARVVDRWMWLKSGTHTINSSQPGESIVIPGTSYLINDRSLTLTLGTQQATLGAGDYGWIFQNIEGSQLRPLFNDSHSVSILIKSSVANLKFSYCIQDFTATHSFVKLCSLGAAYTWTLITIPNIPAFPPAGTWTTASGAVGALEGLCFGSGTTWTGSSDGVWLNAGALAAPGTTNWFGSSVGATVSVAFIQHEPSSVCSTLMDKPFTQNLDECERYFQKSYPYPFAPGTVSGLGCRAFYIPAAALNTAYGNIGFPTTMAKTPTVNFWSPSGAAGAAGLVGGGDGSVTNSVNAGDSGFDGITFSTNWTAGQIWQAHYTADTGW